MVERYKISIDLPVFPRARATSASNEASTSATPYGSASSTLDAALSATASSGPPSKRKRVGDKDTTASATKSKKMKRHPSPSSVEPDQSPSDSLDRPPDSTVEPPTSSLAPRSVKAGPSSANVTLPTVNVAPLPPPLASTSASKAPKASRGKQASTSQKTSQKKKAVPKRTDIRKPKPPEIFLDHTSTLVGDDQAGSDQPDEDRAATRAALLKKALDPAYAKAVQERAARDFAFYTAAYNALADELTKVQVEASVLENLLAAAH